MQTRIGHLHIIYRVPQGLPSTSVLVPALERVASAQIAAVCDEAFAETFAEDPTVRVIRKVSTRVAVVSRPNILESRIAREWGHRLSKAVVESIAAGDPENVVCFANQAEFVTSFLTELTTGDVWSKWYYGAFAGYRDLTVAEAILAVLDENRDWVFEVFRRLRQKGALERLLACLGREHQKRLWKEVIRRTPQQDSAEAFLIFVSSALSLLDALELWSRERPSDRTILKAYLDGGPTTPQWTNTSSLADAVADVVQFVVSAGWMSVHDRLDGDQVARLEQALARNFDWLDVPRLTNRVLTILQSTVAAQPAERRFVLRPSSLTTTQKRLLEKLTSLLSEHTCALDLTDENPHANLFRLLSALSDAGLSSVETITPLLESIVSVWLALRRTSNSHEIVANLRRHSTLIAEHSSLAGFTEELRRQLEVISAKGEPVIAVVEQLLKESNEVAEEASLLIVSDCAGLFLLARTLHDVRLASVLHDCEFQPLESLLTGLAICLGGVSSLRDQRMDPGAALWAGIEPADAPAELKLLETLDRERFAATFDELLSAQRLFESDALTTFAVETPVAPCTEEVLQFLQHTAGKLLRAWARWLPGLSNSSASYLHKNFIQRPGTIAVSASVLEVRLGHGSLDSILQMAGYLEETPAAKWLGNRRVRFRIGD